MGAGWIYLIVIGIIGGTILGCFWFSERSATALPRVLWFQNAAPHSEGRERRQQADRELAAEIGRLPEGA